MRSRWSSSDEPDRVVGARRGAPLLVGLGIGENFLGSDAQALIQVTNRMMYLEEDDVVEITRDSVRGLRPRRRSRSSARCTRASCPPMRSSAANTATTCRRKSSSSRARWPTRWKSRIGAARRAAEHLRHRQRRPAASRSRGLHIIACGTSYHAGMVAKYWIEEFARLPVSVEVASEYRYRDVVVPADTLFVAISQSGETADTLAAMRESRRRGYLGTLAICNVPESSLVREADLKLMTRAGPEIGVASTKAFTTQLAGAGPADAGAGPAATGWTPSVYADLCAELQHLPRAIEERPEARAGDHRTGRRLHPSPARAVPRPRRAVSGGAGRRAEAQGDLLHPRRGLSGRRAQAWSAGAGRREHAGGRGGAERPAAGQAQVQPAGSARARRRADRVRRRRGRHGRHGGVSAACCGWIPAAASSRPAVFTVPLQLLAYHVAVLRGTDVDQPRNLAKSVTVE